jgi:uncharacterized membrane protein YeaQ/YmgE (transglycosylase-associated protein family)
MVVLFYIRAEFLHFTSKSAFYSRFLPVGWNWTAFLVAVLGAIALLAVLNLLFGSRRTR